MADLIRLNPKKILVCQLRQIGDVILTTPAISLLRERYPDAEIHLYTEKICARLLENNPEITRIWALDKSWSPLKCMAFYWKVARQGYDLVIDFQQLPRCLWVVLFSMAKVRLSFTAKWPKSLLYTHTSPPFGKYAAKLKASTLTPLGIHWMGHRPRIYLTDEERKWARDFLREQGVKRGQLLVTVDPTHRRATRKWPADRYGEVIRQAVDKRPDLKFLILCGPGEEKVGEKVLKASKSPENCILPERVLTLREMAAVIHYADLHLGNCSAPRHVAVAVDTPSLIIIGSTGTTAWKHPSPKHQIVCLYLECGKCNENVCPKGTMDCLMGVTPERVLCSLLPRLPEEGDDLASLRKYPPEARC